MFFVAGLIPMIIGFIYYHPKVMGGAWMKANNFTEESLKGGNMAVTFGISYVLSVLAALALSTVVIHQTHIFSLFVPEVFDDGSAIQTMVNSLMAEHGGRYRSFGHGALHAAVTAFTLILPVMATNALFEQKGAKYIFINFGYWLITLVLMGGLLCQTLNYA